MGVWPEVMGGCWPPLPNQPETPHEAAIADREKEDEPVKARRVRKPIADD